MTYRMATDTKVINEKYEFYSKQKTDILTNK